MKLTPRRMLAAAAVAFVAIVILISRFVGGPSGGAVPGSGSPAIRPGNDVAVGTASSTSSSPSEPAGPAPTSGTADAGGEDGGSDGADDGAEDPILVQPTSAPDVKEAATAFAAAWLNVYGQTADQWRAKVLARVTSDLAGSLAEADPDSVPRAARAGKVSVAAQGSLMEAAAAIVTDDSKRSPVGTLRLTLVQQDGVWLVSEIDWEAR